MSVKFVLPPSFKGKSYERYRIELDAWKEITDLDKNKQAVTIALSLPEDDETRIREKIFDELKIEDLTRNDGLKTLMKFMDEKLKKDDLADSWYKFDDFEELKRSKGQSVIEYIANFDQKYQKLVKIDMTLPSEILAFKLLKRANLSHEERLLVLTGMDYSKKEILYDQAKESLKKFKGDQAYGGMCSSGPDLAIKLEPGYLAEHEEALFAAGYQKVNRGNAFSRGNRRPYSGNGNQRSEDFYSGKQRGAEYSGKHRSENYNRGGGRSTYRNGNMGNKTRNVNPIGNNGNVLTCAACGSFRHLLGDCPDSWENLEKANICKSKDNVDVILFTGGNKVDISELGNESRNCIVLDSACSSTVCGKQWLDLYLESLDSVTRKNVKSTPGKKTFKFGGGEKLRSIGTYHIPAILAGRKITIQTDVVQSDIPLLFSLKDMKQAKIKLDLEKDTAEIFGKIVYLNSTNSGHYCLPIGNMEVPAESVCAVRLEELNKDELHKVLVKLHRQFAHPSEEKLITLLDNAGVWDAQYSMILKKIYDACKICKQYAKTPARPVVGLPMASRFNEKVAMDLKSWKGRWILHLVDMWSRLTVSVFVDRKKPSEIIDKIMTH